ncbi:hypothetical protein, partial [Pisciglobus halotolerans]|uniref:hypothetical protein n=1 Tax=Pisciglobus halotolerans TaxID=745365 RepID=UPI001C434D2A
TLVKTPYTLVRLTLFSFQRSNFLRVLSQRQLLNGNIITIACQHIFDVFFNEYLFTEIDASASMTFIC